MNSPKEQFPTYEYPTFPRQFVSYRWYKPLLVAALVFVFLLIFQVILLIAASIAAHDPNFLDTVGDSYETMNPFTGPGALFELGAIAVLLPALAIAALIVRDRPFSSYTSSRGGWNWGAFLKCLGVGLAIFAILTAVQLIAFPEEGADGIIRFTVAGVILGIILTPLQCMAEEYIFRGLILQAFSSWTKVPAIGIAASAVVFALGHPYNVMGMVCIFINGILFGVMAWHTRGLEAPGALHIVNNMFAFGTQGLGLSVATSEIDLVAVIIDIATFAVYAAIVMFVGKKYNWFASKGDGAAEFNEKKLAKMELKRQRKAARGVPAHVQPLAVSVEQGMAQQPYPPQQGYRQQDHSTWQGYPQQAYPPQSCQVTACPQPAANQPQGPDKSAWPEPPRTYRPVG